MKPKIITLLVFCVVFTACNTVPLTGRKQLSLVSSGQLAQMADSQYGQFLNENKVITGTSASKRVKTVGHKLANAVTTYLKQNGYSQLLSELKLDWEFNLIQSEQKNAWCMPGGKVAVYTGILPITKNETGLATVMGHEIAHAIARHSSERMSQGLMAMGIQIAGNIALSNKDPKTVGLFNGLYGIGSQVGYLLPNSRKQESEADRLGLIFMAMAGYDPSSAIGFWQRMQSGAGAKPPEFLSTHPSDATRIRKIKGHLAEAMKYYKQ